MGKITLLFCLSMIAPGFGASPALSAPRSDERVEIAIDNVMIPAKGFDDNDHVQAVVTGELPHACFTLGETQIERRENNTLRVHQYGWVRTTGRCSGNDVSDVSVPYTAEISLGRLNAGQYQIEYRSERGVLRREFKVDVADTEAVDNYPYALVTDASAPPVFDANDEAYVEIIGMYDSSCASIGSRFRVLRQADVFVVLPIQNRAMGQECRKTMHEFHRRVELGRLESGQYLVHARSMNGKAVNFVFSVLKQ